MAAPNYTDRQLAADVRRLSLKKIKRLLEKEEENTLDSNEQRLYEAVLLKLASTVLPRINEHTGEDGGAILIKVAKEISDQYETPQDTSGSSEG